MYKNRIILLFQIAIFFITVYCGMGVFTASSHAVDLIVTNESDSGAGSLRTVLSSAADGDTVSFADEIKHIQILSPIIIEKSVDIRGNTDKNGNPKVTIISPENNPVFNYSSNSQLGLYGITIETTKDQSMNTVHASVYSRNGKIVVEDCKFIGANQYNCSAIFTGIGEVIIKKSSFEKYNAQYGGAVLCINGPITVFDSSFTKNTAYQGGAIHCTLNDICVYNSEFIGNIAHQGGAIHCIVNDVHVYNSTFRKNTANYGGAISSNNGKIMVANSQFTYGNALIGGAICNDSKDVNIYSSSFVNNYASYGVAVATLNDGDIILINTTLYGNTSSNTNDDNGVIECKGKTVLVQTTLTNNKAIGIFSKVIGTHDTSNVYAYNSIIVGNTDQTGNPKQSNVKILGGANIIEDIPAQRENPYNIIFGNAKFEDGHIAPLTSVPRIELAPSLTSSSFSGTHLSTNQIAEILHAIQTDALGRDRIAPNIFGAIEKLEIPSFNTFKETIIIWSMAVLLFIPPLLYMLHDQNDKP